MANSAFTLFAIAFYDIEKVISFSLQSSNLCFQSVDFSHLGNIDLTDFVILCFLSFKHLLLISNYP